MAAQDESLRLVAEVVDKFSTPLRNLRTMLQGVQSPAGMEKMRTSFEGTQKAAGALSREVGNTLTPALNAAGIAGLNISGALLGVGAALRSFGSSTSTLSLLGRETGMTVNAMRTLEEVGKRFNLAPEAMQQSFRSFTENAQQLKKGAGDVTGFMHSQSPAVSKWAADLQRDLRNGLNPEEAYKRSLEFMRRISAAIKDVSDALKNISWKETGTAIVTVMRAIGTAVTDAAAGINHLNAAITAFREGRYLDTLRALDGHPHQIVPGFGMKKGVRSHSSSRKSLWCIFAIDDGGRRQRGDLSLKLGDACGLRRH